LGSIFNCFPDVKLAHSKYKTGKKRGGGQGKRVKPSLPSRERVGERVEAQLFSYL